MVAMRVKICGVTRVSDALAAEAAGADAIGLMFVPESKRVIELKRAQEIRAALGPLIVAVGVFRNAPLEQVLATSAELRLGAVQLHGQEDDDYLAAVRELVPVIKAVSYSPTLSAAGLADLPADAILVDGLRPGSGEAFDWQQAGRLRDLPRLILAGGLHPGNVAAGVSALRPYGVDVSSGVERRPGMKDPELVASFVATARSALARATGERASDA